MNFGAGRQFAVSKADQRKAPQRLTLLRAKHFTYLVQTVPLPY